MRELTTKEKKMVADFVMKKYDEMIANFLNGYTRTYRVNPPKRNVFLGLRYDVN